MRLDQALIDYGLCDSIKEAQGLIMANQVLVNDAPVTKAGATIKQGDLIRLRENRTWVSRSAEKLLEAIKAFDFQVSKKSFVDIGASTGGFTQVLLYLGASKVLALDVAYGFLNHTLRNDERVEVLERTHICDIEQFSFEPDAFVIDVSFIHPLKVLKHLQTIIKNWQGIILFKPQFAATNDQLEKGIVVETELEGVKSRFEEAIKILHIQIIKQVPAAIKGTKGNQEFVYWLKW